MSDFLAGFEIQNDAIANNPLSHFVVLGLTTTTQRNPCCLCLKRIIHICSEKLSKCWDITCIPNSRVALAITIIIFAFVAISSTVVFVTIHSRSHGEQGEQGKAKFDSPLVKAAVTARRVGCRHVNQNVVPVRCLADFSSLPSYVRQLNFCGSSSCTAPDFTHDALLPTGQIEEVNILGPYNPSLLFQLLRNIGNRLETLQIDVDAFCSRSKSKMPNFNSTEAQLFLPHLLRLTITNSKRCSLNDMGFKLNVPNLRHLRLQNSVLDKKASLNFVRLLDSCKGSIEQIFVSRTNFPPYFQFSPLGFPKLQIFDFAQSFP